jgi:bacteriorhodopsin
MIGDILNYFTSLQNSYKLFSQTLNFSISIQIITGLIEFFTLFIQVKPVIIFLKQLLLIEFIVQIIELTFYIWLYVNLSNVANITSKRYADWIITTPTMLFTLIMYLIYTKTKNKEQLNLYESFKQNKQTIFIIVLLNLIMLIFGYLGETQQFSNLQNKFLYLTFGFIPFLIYFWLIYDRYAKYTDFGKKLFYYFFIVWTFYGIVAYLPYYLRNSFYNILDLFAKNFFGLYLSYLIIRNSFNFKA